MQAFPVTADFEHLDACLEAASRGTAEAWVKALALSVSDAILDHARIDPDQFASLMAKGLSGDTLPRNMPGYLARKALRTGDPGFVHFVHAIRPSLSGLVENGADAAAAYLPKPWPDHVVVRFAGFAFADAFSPGNPVINLGDFYFGVYQRIQGDETDRMNKTLGLLRRVIAHEVHHTSLGRFLHFPETPNSEWLLKLLISEGSATLLLLPFTEDDSYYFANWQRHTGRFKEYLAELPQVLAAGRERVPEDTLQRWVMSVGACYYVGATMAGAIEEALGRGRLVKSLADIGSFFSAYDAAALAKGLPRLTDDCLRHAIEGR